MLSNFEDLIQKIGLDKEEAEVYLACLKHDGLTFEQIQDETKIEKEVLYKSINKLSKSNFLTSHFENEIKIYCAEEPKLIEANIKEFCEKFNSFVPILSSLSEGVNKGTSIRYYEGKEGIENILNDILETLKDKPQEKKYFYQMNAIESIFDILPDHQTSFIDKRIEMGILLYWIAPKSEHYWSLASRPDENLRFTRLYNSKKIPFHHMEIDIYDNKIALISFDRDNLGGVLIEDKLMAKSMEALISFIWETLGS